MMRDVPDWVADYVGIPYVLGGEDSDGADCLGLCDLVIRERFGVKITPDLPGVRSGEDGRRVTRAVARGRRSWLAVDRDDLRLADVFVMRVSSNRGRGVHMGLVLNLHGDALHSDEGHNSVVENILTSLALRSRIIGVYRHPEVAA